MIVSIHQPAYLPWLGYLHRIALSDRFLFLDTVQFQKGSFQNRNKIKTDGGWMWLSVPVKKKGHMAGVKLKDLRIDNALPWQRKHIRSLSQYYGQATNFDEVMNLFGPIFNQQWENFSDMCFEMLRLFLEKFEIHTEIIRASSFAQSELSKSELLLHYCQELDADCYIAGPLSDNYLDFELFKKKGIDVRPHHYEHPVYTQQFGDFQANMGAIDLLMNCEHPRQVIF